jgi:hypothetical protein
MSGNGNTVKSGAFNIINGAGNTVFCNNSIVVASGTTMVETDSMNASIVMGESNTIKTGTRRLIIANSGDLQGSDSIIIGGSHVVNGSYDLVIGNSCRANSNFAIALGDVCYSFNFSTAIGSNNKAGNNRGGSDIIYRGSTIIAANAEFGYASFALGSNNRATSTNSIAFGNENISTGNTSVAIGNTNTVHSSYGSAFGFGNIIGTSGGNSIVAGYQNRTNSYTNVVMGYENIVTESETCSYAVVLGANNNVYKTVRASGYAHVLIGVGLETSNQYQHAYGYYNENKADALMEFGIGEDNGSRLNAITLYRTNLVFEANRLKSKEQMYLGNLASDPADTTVGQLYYNTTSNKFRGRTNTGWIDLH